MKKHSLSIETELITSDDGKNTYEIIKRKKDIDGDIGIIISLYPTRNSQNISANDSTLNHLVAHMSDFNFSEIRIINLFSKVVNSRMSSRGLSVDEENMKFINDQVFSDKQLKNHKFIIAWGNSMESSKAVNSSKKQIIEMYLKSNPKGEMSQFVCPERGIISTANHPLFMGIRASNAVWKLLKFDYKSILNSEKFSVQK